MTTDNQHFVDLSHEIYSGMITYPGLPAPVITEQLSREQSRGHYAPGTEFHIGKIEMVANTGTYLDSPFHRYPDGPDLSQLPLTSLANLHGVVVRTTERRTDATAFKGLDLQHKAVLIQTGWDIHWGTERYFKDHPFLTEDAAQFLADSNVALVGIDSLNIDQTDGGHRPAHSILLRANIPVVEHLCGLNQLPDKGFKFFAVPPKVKAFGTFPVRAFAVLD